MFLPYRSRRLGPALKEAPLPMMALSLSVIAHVMGLAGLVILAGSQWDHSKVYVVNLVPAIAAVGSSTEPVRAPGPRPQPASPDEQAATKSPPETRVKSTTPRELPPPGATTEVARIPKEPPVTKLKPGIPKELPPPPPQAEPARVPKEPPVLPRSPETYTPAPRLPGRSGPLPSPGTKELAPLAAAREPIPQAPPTPRRAEPASTLSRIDPVPAPKPHSVITTTPLGSLGGSPTGTASLSLDVSDFPFTLYLSQIVRKVSEKWVPPAQSAEPGRRTLVLFEIGREGQITNPKIEQSSGNSFYDQAALRAVMDASPFPPLPQEFPARVLRVHLGFEPPGGRG